MSSIKLTSKDKLILINTIDENPGLESKGLAEILKDDIKGITHFNITRIKTLYLKDSENYRNSLELSLSESLRGGKINIVPLKTLSIDSKINSIMHMILSKIEDDFASVGKTRFRTRVIKEVCTSDLGGTILTLSHTNCITELVINQLVNYSNTNNTCNFISYEKDYMTYKDLKVSIKEKDLPMKAINGEIKDAIYGKDIDTYSHMILDYCGALTTFKNEIEYSIKNRLVKVGGTISITLSARSGKVVDDLKSLSTKYSDKDNRCDTERIIERFLYKTIQDNYTIEDIFMYNGKGYKSGGAMVSAIIKRLR